VKTIPKAVLVYGTDELRVKERAAQLAALMAPPGDWGVEIIDAWQDDVEKALDCIRRTTEALTTPPLFGTEQFVWMKNASFFSDTDAIKLSSRPEVRASLQQLVQVIQAGLPEGLRLLISVPEARGERAKRAESISALQQLEDSGVFEVEKFHLPSAGPFGSPPPPIDEVIEKCRQCGLQIHPDAVELFVELCSSDPRQRNSELDKLITYCWGQQEILPHHVEAVVCSSAEATFWAWCDAVIEGRTADALRMLQQLRFQGENPVGIIIQLLHHERLVVKVRLLSDRHLLSASGMPLAAGQELLTPVGEKRNPPSQWRLRRILQQSRRFSLAQWQKFFYLTYDTYNSFFETGSDHYVLLQDLVLRLQILLQDERTF